MKRFVGLSVLSVLFVLAALSAVAMNGYAIANDEEEGVRAAVLDYVEGVYEVDPSRIERSVHPELRKLGFYRRGADSPYQMAPMTFEQLVGLAANYNKDGRVPADAPKDVILLDVLDQTASVKLVASWGIDYMHLAKYDGRWKIINVLWQSHPQSE